MEECLSKLREQISPSPKPNVDIEIEVKTEDIDLGKKAIEELKEFHSEH